MTGLLATSPVAAAERPSPDPFAGRRTEELVIALVGPVGAGVSTVARILGELLRDQFLYEVSTYRVSQVIDASRSLLRESARPATLGAERISDLQSLGNSLRERFGTAFLAERCVK